MFCNMYVANNSSILQYCHGMSIEGVLVFYRTTEYANLWKGGGGGLTARQKRKSSLLRPPPPLFPKSRSQKGGRNSGAVRYIHVHSNILRLFFRYNFTTMQLRCRNDRSTIVKLLRNGNFLMTDTVLARPGGHTVKQR